MAALTWPELFEDLHLDEFQFHKLNSNVTQSCISLPSIVYVPIGGQAVREVPTATTPKLAVHISFNCKVSGLSTSDRLNLAITAFRFTARPVTGQLTIDEHGPSVLTAKESIHINCNTGWGRPDHMQELLRKLDGPSEDDVLSVLNFNFGRSVRSSVIRFREKIEKHAALKTRITNITFDRSDKTFPIE